MSKENIRPNEVGAPTIFIGLGGTGGKIVRGVAEMCKEGETENIAFVCLDTNANDLTMIKKSKAQIRYVQTSNTQTVGDYLDYDEDARKNWFPKNAVMYDKTVSEGAGQVRAISRLALNATIKTGRIAPLYDAIDDLFRKSGKDLKQALRVVLVSTSSGGTGSGIVLPIAMMIREYVKNKYPNTALLTRGLILLPETFDSVISSTQERESQRRNAYATIKELNAFMMKGSGFFDIDEDLKRYKDMAVDYVTADGTKKSLALLPMDFCFLMDGQDAEDATMINLNQYMKLASQALYEQNIGPMQKNAFSVEDNIIKELSAPGNLGRNRFGGIGASMLRYPYEQITDYVAYGWALDNIGADGTAGKWGQYDRDFEVQAAEAKKKGLSRSESPQRDQTYIGYFESEEPRDTFTKDIKNMYLADVDEAMETYFDALKFHTHEAFNKNKKIQNAVDGLDTVPLGTQGSSGVSSRLNSLQELESTFRQNAKRIAHLEADSLFMNEKETINETSDYRLETLLKSGDEIAHPVAARYIFYKARIQFKELWEDATTRKRKEEDNLRYYSGSPDEGTVFTVKGVKKKFSSFEALCRAEGTIKKKKNLYPVLEDLFNGYQSAIEQYAAAVIDEETYQKGYEFLDDVCKMYEKFFRSFKEKVSGLVRKRGDLVQEIKFNKGDSIVNICSDREVLEELARTTMKQADEGSMLDKELNGQIYDAVKANVAFERENRSADVVEEDKSVDIFDDIVLDYFRKSVRKTCETLDVNIVQAIALEYRLKERLRMRKEIENSVLAGGEKQQVVDHISKEKTERYILDTVDLATRLAAPSIQRINNEEPREVRCAAYHVSLDSMRDYEMSQLFGKGVNASGCDSVDPRELHFFIALYNLTPDKLNKFASPLVAETRVKNAGLYHNAYTAYGRNLGPDSTKNMLISTHIDKTWDSIAFMPEMDMAYMSKRMMRIHQSLIYALVYKAIKRRNLSAAAGGKMVYRYENSDERTVDLIVSNGTPCDEFYEILDALYIDASVVEDINLVREKKTQKDMLRNSSYEKTSFYDCVKNFSLPMDLLADAESVALTQTEDAAIAQKDGDTAEEDRASLFEIPLGYYNSLPNSQRYTGEIAGLINAVVETFRQEIGYYASEDDAKFMLCDILVEQFALLVRNYRHHRKVKTIMENKVVDLIYRKIRNVISETPEPDNCEEILKGLKSMVEAEQQREEAEDREAALA